MALKKIGIITKHKIFNYGSFFQAFATQTLIEDLGHEVYIIDYFYPNEFHKRKVSLKSKILNYGNSVFKNLLPGRPFKLWRDRYVDCQNNYYKLTQPFCNYESIMKNPPDLDIYVSGSDQIWRPDFTNGDPVFFCDFAPKNKKRISFASSFGVLKIPEKYEVSYKNMLAKYSHLSVREDTGIQIITELTNRKAKLVLDPTLLLKKKVYQTMLKPPKNNKPYILCYGMANNDYMEKLAKYIQKHTNYDIIRINGKSYDYFNTKMKYILDAGPLEWLGLFSGASFILAQSFHATAFSIIFEKPFLAILRGDSNHDSRQINLLKLLGISNKALTTGEKFPDFKSIDLDMDYTKINIKLEIERLESLEFLKQAIEN